MYLFLIFHFLLPHRFSLFMSTFSIQSFSFHFLKKFLLLIFLHNHSKASCSCSKPVTELNILIELLIFLSDSLGAFSGILVSLPLYILFIPPFYVSHNCFFFSCFSYHVSPLHLSYSFISSSFYTCELRVVLV